MWKMLLCVWNAESILLVFWLGKNMRLLNLSQKNLLGKSSWRFQKKTKTTLITHLEDAKEIVEIAKFIGVDFVQLHSNIAEDEVAKIRKNLPNVKIIRLIHISQDGRILTDYKRFKFVDFYFTDSINEKTNQVGGTGLVHDYNTDRFLAETLDKPLFLAGGLNPENVANAIKFVKPFAVDVNSGCRGANGFRDKENVKKFVFNAKNALK